MELKVCRLLTVVIMLFLSTISFAQDRKKLDMIGALNAVRKAHQLTNLPIQPGATLFANKKKTYKGGKEYHGMIYSSAKELNSFVGRDVSIYTFMTALNNPRSVLYTERIDLPPYHGVNCMAYYGTVCSGLINYALGITITQRSSDILVADCFELIEDQSARGIQLADLVCKKGHPALVTGIEKDNIGRITRIEMCSARESGCCRYYIEGEVEFNKRLKQKNLQIYRYKDLYKNTSYTPANEFVAVDGEVLKSFRYNEDICPNKGDKSCYVTGENVVLNVLKGGEKVEIYKDSKLFKVIDIHNKDTNLILKDYPYGDYQARVVSLNRESDYARWKIIDVDVKIDKERRLIFFKSANANPIYYEFCSITGSRPTNKNRIYAAEFTDEDINKGYVKVVPPKKPTKGKTGFSYIKVHFECDYGIVINRLTNWFE